MESVIKEGRLRLQTCEASCDVILSCQGQRLMAHKIVLSIASSILRDLLTQDLTEPSVIIFPDISGNTMSMILDYIYTGTVIVYSNTIKDFITAANLLKIHIDIELVDKFNYSRTKECKIEKNEDVSMGITSNRNQREIPALVPIANLPRNKLKHNRKLVSCVLPSPWCPRGRPMLSDPRTYCRRSSETMNGKPYTILENDANNNLEPPSDSPRNLSTKMRSYPMELELNSLHNSAISLKKLPQSKISLRSITDEDGFIETIPVVPKSELLEKVTIKKEFALEEKSSGEDIQKHKPFMCEDCGKSFSQLRNYKYHRSIHEGTKEFAAKCSECGKIFNDRGYLSSHMKIHRDRKEYACPHCPKRFNQRVAYNMHLRIHTGIKPHECPTCGKTFSRKMLLKQHQRVHTGERPYSCPECGKTFADRSNMSLHARLHTGVKPYACNLCPKSFTKKHHLKTHMNYHTGLKPYSCEKCGLAFSQSSNMRTHYKKCILKEAAGSSFLVDNMDADSNSSVSTDAK